MAALVRDRPTDAAAAAQRRGYTSGHSPSNPMIYTLATVLLLWSAPAPTAHAVLNPGFRHTCVVANAKAPARAHVVIADASARREAARKAPETLTARVAHRHSAAR